MPDPAELGKRIKKVREEKHLTLKNIEAKAGISATHISEIERGKTSPTLGALMRIALALDKDPAYFVEELDLGDASIVTRENRIEESLGNGAGSFERLTASIPGGRLQACMITLNPGHGRQEEHDHAGHEAALILAGSVRFSVSGRTYDLAEGDSIAYDAGEPHYFHNTSAGAARLVWVCTERNVT